MSLDRREFLLALAAVSALPAAAKAASWRAGFATVNITPPLGVWMGGYAARKEPAQGIAQPLHAKALAVADSAGHRAVVVTLDVLGLTEPAVDRIANAVRRQYGLSRRQLLLCSSHTHSGPIIRDQLAVAYDLRPVQWDQVRASTRRIEGQVIEAAGRALGSMQPAHLRWAQGEAGFAANRRTAINPDGPVDHAVPVLAVERPDGRLAGVVFGYACHNTTLPASFVRYHGDYAGVAKAELERRHPGATALFIQGCGADANPQPRGTLELAEQHGRELADAVDCALAGAAEVTGPLRTAFTTVSLAYAPAPGAEAWRRKLDDENVYVRRHAQMMLDVIARDGAHHRRRTRAVARPAPRLALPGGAQRRSGRRLRAGDQAEVRQRHLGGRLHRQRVRVRAVGPRPAGGRLRRRRGDALLRAPGSVRGHGGSDGAGRRRCADGCHRRHTTEGS